MSRERLAELIQMREEGRAKQDEAILEQVRTLLLELVAAYPDDAEVHYQTAVVHDNLGMGEIAIPHYQKALALGLTGPDLEGALLGLGSTYRALGHYPQAVEILRRGVQEFPNHRGLQTFLAIALYNTQAYKESVELLLNNLLETTSDDTILFFKRALTYYAAHLDETW